MIHLSSTETYILDLLLALFSIKGVFFLIFVALQVLDYISTIKALKAGAQEKNPIARWVMEKTGKAGTIGFKAIFILLTLGFLCYIPLWALGLVSAYYVYIVIKNFRLARGK